jgi:hypothetical protein
MNDMSLHPARVVAGVLLITGSVFVGVIALAIVMAKLLVAAGMPISPSNALLLTDLITVLPFVAVFAVVGVVAAAGLLRGKGWSDTLAFGTAIAAVAVGAVGLILLSIGRDPFASTASARSTDDGIGIISAFTALYLLVIVAVAVARLPRHTSTRRMSTGAMA